MRPAVAHGWRIPRGLGACALAIVVLLHGCGGGREADDAAAREADAAAAPSSVQLMGCVVDERHALRPGRSVRVLDAQGQALGEAVSDAQGEFALQVPARQWLTVMVLPEGGDLLQARAGTQDVWLTSCLSDPAP